MISVATSYSKPPAIWGNPYIGVLTEWSDLSYQRRQRLVQEHPGIDETAEKIRREREEFRRSLEKMMNSPVDRFIDQMVIPMSRILHMGERMQLLKLL